MAPQGLRCGGRARARGILGISKKLFLFFFCLGSVCGVSAGTFVCLYLSVSLLTCLSISTSRVTFQILKFQTEQVYKNRQMDVTQSKCVRSVLRVFFENLYCKKIKIKNKHETITSVACNPSKQSLGQQTYINIIVILKSLSL